MLSTLLHASCAVYRSRRCACRAHTAPSCLGSCHGVCLGCTPLRGLFPLCVLTARPATAFYLAGRWPAGAAFGRDPTHCHASQWRPTGSHHCETRRSAHTCPACGFSRPSSVHGTSWRQQRPAYNGLQLHTATQGFAIYFVCARVFFVFPSLICGLFATANNALRAAVYRDRILLSKT